MSGRDYDPPTIRRLPDVDLAHCHHPTSETWNAGDIVVVQWCDCCGAVSVDGVEWRRPFVLHLYLSWRKYADPTHLSGAGGEPPPVQASAGFEDPSEPELLVDPHRKPNAPPVPSPAWKTQCVCGHALEDHRVKMIEAGEAWWWCPHCKCPHEGVHAPAAKG